MKRNNLKLDDYRIITAVAEENGYRPASQRLGISPSQLSRQVNHIEGLLGVRLFDRSTRNVLPTPQGRKLIELGKRLLQTAEKVENDFHKYLQKGRGQLSIAGLPSITSALLPALLEEFTTQYANLDVQIHDGLNNRILSLLENGEADLGFSAGTDSTRSQLSFRKLADDPFVVIFKPENELATKESFSWEEVTQLPFIAMSKGTSVREIVESACTLTGTNLSIRYEVSHLSTAGALVAQGLGVTVLPKLTLPSLGNRPLLTRPISNLKLTRDIGAVWPSGVTLSPSAQAFLELATVMAPRLFAHNLPADTFHL